MSPTSTGTAFRIDDLVRDAVARVWPRVRAQGVRLAVFVDDGLPSGLRGDAVGLLAELVSRLEREVTAGAAVVQVRVRPDGFDAADRAQVIVELSTGSGATPSALQRAYDLAPRSVLEPATAPAGLRVLVVDDDPVSRSVLGGIVRRAGCEPTLVDGGLPALQALDADIDCVLLDMMMPDLPGLEVARRVRDAGNNVPIVGVSANPFGADRRLCVLAGMNDYLAKPPRPDEVVRMLGRWG